MNILDIFRSRIYSFKNSRLQRLNNPFLENFRKPTFLCLKLTEKCNSKCIHCDIWKQDRGNNELTTNEWLNAIDNIRKWTGPAYLVLTGGEIFLRKDATNIIRHASSKGMVVEALSNGLLLNKDLCEQIVLTNPYQFTMSLDGITPETHFSVRNVKGMHEKITEAVKDLHHFKTKYNSKMRILLKMVIMKNNLHEVLQMADWVKEQGVSLLQVQPVEQSYGQREDLYWYKNSNLWINDIEKLKHVIQGLIARKLSGYPLNNTIEYLESVFEYFSNPDEHMRQMQSHNLPGEEPLKSGNMEVSANGDVRWEFYLPPAGNLKDSSPKDLWNKRNR